MIGGPGYYGRPVDDPDGEAAAIVQEQADDRDIARQGDELAGCFPAAARPGSGDFASGRDLEWCQTHQTRHVPVGAVQPVRLPVDNRPAPTVTIDYPPRPFRMAIMDGGRELVVLSMRDGRLCASYDDDDLDQGARRFLDRVLELNRAEIDISTNDPVWYGGHTFDCAYVYAHGTCSSAFTTAEGYVGPWQQLFDHGWRRNGDGAWQCPVEHAAVS